MGASKPDNAPADEMRTLPDGGLSDAMPEWLRRPPAWRELAAKEMPEESRRLPEPDTSIIDPRTFIDVSDLPPWLQAIAARDGERAVGEAPAGDEPAPEATLMASNDETPEQPTTEPRRVRFEPAGQESDDDGIHKILFDPNASGRRISQPMMLAIGAGVLAVIVVIILAVAVF